MPGASRSALLPYLVVKRREAEIVLELCERLARWTPGVRLTAEEISERNAISERLTLVRPASRGVTTAA